MTLAQYPTYGELYHGVATTTGEIPFAIYRTEKSQTNVSKMVKSSLFNIMEV